MRTHVSRLSIDVNGFELVYHETCVDTLYDDDLIQPIQQRVRNLLNNTLCLQGVIFDHTRRSKIGRRQSTRWQTGPAVRAHVDILLNPDHKSEDTGRKGIRRHHY